MGQSESVSWFTTSPSWTSAGDDNHKSELLSPRNNTKPIPNVYLTELIEKSSKFPRPFPDETIRCHQLEQQGVPKEILERNINSAYPVIHEHTLYLCSIFLIQQKQSGNKKFYQNMSLLDFIDRLLGKRAVCFIGAHDQYLLMDGTEGAGGWEKIGTSDEVPPLVLENCLSFDEIKLSALLSVSSHTVFLNEKRGQQFRSLQSGKEMENNGVIIGLVGAVFHKPNEMDYKEIMKTPKQNNQLRNLFVSNLQSKISKFYGDSGYLENLLLKIRRPKDRYVEIVGDHYFDKLIYSRRMSLPVDTFLIEANDRAKKLNKMAYVHVSGIGLGLWCICHEQPQIFVNTFVERLELLVGVLTNISDICFANMDCKVAGTYKHGDQLGRINLHIIDHKFPYDKLTGVDEGKLLVVSYAGDGNALPGNQFWLGQNYLRAVHAMTSETTAAYFTQMTELHNCHINDKVSARNLRVATLNGLVTFREYQEMHRHD